MITAAKKHSKFIVFAVVIVIAFASQTLFPANPMSAISEQNVPLGEPFAEIIDNDVPLAESAIPEDPLVAEVLALVNAERAKTGAGPLTGTEALHGAASVRASEISKVFSHYRPDGTLCFTVLTEFKIQSFSRAENIAGNFRSPEKVVEAWMKSEGHRKNILNPNYDKLGVGVHTDSSGKLSWAQLFIGEKK